MKFNFGLTCWRAEVEMPTGSGVPALVGSGRFEAVVRLIGRTDEGCPVGADPEIALVS